MPAIAALTPVIVLATLGILHLWPVAGPNRLPQNLDLMLQYVPNAAHLARGLTDGTIPLWNPWQGGGLPFAANPGTGAWYPTSWALLSVLPLWDAVRVSLWLHLAVAIAGMWRCLRGPLHATTLGALVGTVAFTLSPWLPGLTGMPVVLTSLAWLPWVVDAGLRLVQDWRVRPRTVAILGLATAAQVVGGWPAGAYLSWIVLGAAVALRLPWRDWSWSRTRPRHPTTWSAGIPAHPSPRKLPTLSPARHGEHSQLSSWDTSRKMVDQGSPSIPSLVSSLVSLLSAGLLAAAIAAVVLIPAGAFISRTTYSGTRQVESVANDGYLTLLSWLRPAAGAGALEGGQVSIGVVALTLAAISPILLRHSPTGRVTLKSWGSIAVVSILLSWGTRTPLFGLFYTWIPGFRILYLPARLGIVASFAMACLAAAVIDRFASAAANGPSPSLQPPYQAQEASPRDAQMILAVGASLPPLVLAQFWHAEGYDNFRRLLTNLWRVNGGPFLSVPQELHAVVFGLATIAIVVMALHAKTTRLHLLAAVLTATAVVDVGVLAVTSTGPSFDPRVWYAPAFAAAPAVREAIGHDRFASLPWHAGDPDASQVRHFLGDFPSSTRPGMLPPNLGLLVGVRDAQAYDPLILRATASAFADGGAPDDHWAWLATYDPRTTRSLAIREVVAAPEASWRVPTRTLGAAVARCCDPIAAWDGEPPVDWDRLHIVAFLGEGTNVVQGRTVAEVTLTMDVATRVVALRAGMEVSEWAFDRPDVRGRIGHAQAPIALITRVVGAVGGRYDTFEYRTTVTNNDRALLRGITVRATVPGVTVQVVQLAIDPPASPWQPSTLGWRDASEDASRLRIDPADAGVATWVLDGTDRLQIKATLTRPARVTIADTPYPGWVATVDGRTVPIIETAGTLTRAIDLTAGDHVVDLRFEPTDVQIGRLVSLVGLAVASALLIARKSLI
jgi:hypothetical protein